MMKDEFDLVFMDIDMPKMNGIEAAQRMRVHENQLNQERRKVEIIAVTANIHPETRIKCKQAGMNRFLPKPVDRETIKNQLLKSWRRVKSRQPTN